MKKIKTTILASLIGLSLGALASAQQEQPMPGYQGSMMQTQGTAYGIYGAPRMGGGIGYQTVNSPFAQPAPAGWPQMNNPAPPPPPVVKPAPNAPPTPPPPPKIKKVRVLTTDGWKMIPADQL